MSLDGLMEKIIASFAQTQSASFSATVNGFEVYFRDLNSDLFRTSLTTTTVSGRGTGKSVLAIKDFEYFNEHTKPLLEELTQKLMRDGVLETRFEVNNIAMEVQCISKKIIFKIRAKNAVKKCLPIS